MNPLTTCGDLYDQRISVCVRVRPLNKKEINRKELSVTTIPTADKIMVGFTCFLNIRLINFYIPTTLRNVLYKYVSGLVFILLNISQGFQKTWNPINSWSLTI